MPPARGAGQAPPKPHPKRVSILSRSAEGLYWAGRNLERAAQLCRLLQLQVEALVDRPVEEIHFGWRRIYRSLRRTPPGGREGFDGGDDYTLADSYTLAGDLTLERDNPCSLWSCFAGGRENARQVRHCISAEMWTGLNLAWLRLKDATMQEIWRTAPEAFYAATARDLDTFAGVAQATSYHDEGWLFMRLGRFIERGQLIVALLRAQIDAAPLAEEENEAQWIGLLRACHAIEPYRRRHGLAVEPAPALDLLVSDARLPHSLCHALHTVQADLTELGPGPGQCAGTDAAGLAGRLCAMAEFDWRERQPTSEDLGAALLEELEAGCRRLHELATAAYFEYSVENAPTV